MLLDWLIFIGSTLVILVVIVAVVIWICRTSESCLHLYSRIDDCNDKNMILVCRRYSKIMKLRK